VLPNFFVIGAAKAGTTSLYHYLASHPQVYMSPIKEPDFFLPPPSSGQPRSGRPAGDHRRGMYETLFAGAGDAAAVGEASVRYSAHPFRPGAAERIAALVPDAKLIYIVREPVTRMVSQWMHNRRVGTESRGLAQALRCERYLLLSSYAFQVERFLEHFPARQLLVIVSEDLHQRRAHTLDRVWRFLGVSTGHLDPVLDRELNRAPSASPQLPSALVSDLHQRLRSDVARLRDYVAEPFDGWGIA
jgi:Sulfotransferase family